MIHMDIIPNIQLPMPATVHIITTFTAKNIVWRNLWSLLMFEKETKDKKYRDNPYRAVNFSRDEDGNLVSLKPR